MEDERSASLKGDAAEAECWEKAVARALQRFGTVDVLVTLRESHREHCQSLSRLKHGKRPTESIPWVRGWGCALCCPRCNPDAMGELSTSALSLLTCRSQILRPRLTRPARPPWRQYTLGRVRKRRGRDCRQCRRSRAYLDADDRQHEGLDERAPGQTGSHASLGLSGRGVIGGRISGVGRMHLHDGASSRRRWRSFHWCAQQRHWHLLSSPGLSLKQREFTW